MTGVASPSNPNVILTGIARSGTTLACTLLNRLPDTVALHEPIPPRLLLGLSDPKAAVAQIERFFQVQRESLLTRGEGASRGLGGAIPDNPYGDAPGPDGLRRSVVREGIVRFEKPLSPGFRLVIKHPSCFTALLGDLVGRFPCFAMVRNPLAILLSWQTTAANWNDGRQPAAEAFDDSLRAVLDATPDAIGRQIAMLGWSFGQYARHLPDAAVIRYERLVASGGAALVPLAPAAVDLAEGLGSRNANDLYRKLPIARLAERLLRSDGPQWSFYSRDSVAALAGELTGG